VSHSSPEPTDICIYRVTHAACGWKVLTHDWQLLADDHAADCEAEPRADLDYDFRVQCTIHNPEDDRSKASRVVVE
jgi:hypothetical protein